MLNKKRNVFSLLLLFIICLLLFWRFFFKNEFLFPGNYLIAFFSPYQSYNSVPISNKPVADDVFRHIYTFKVLAVDMMKNLHLPLWNPYNGAGMPLLATLNSGFLDPFNILFFIFPYANAWNIYLFLQFLLIGLFTYLYSRSIGLSQQAALFASISFLFSGFVIARVSLGAYGLGIALLPLFLFLIERYRSQKNWKIFGIISIVVFSVIVSTHPQISFYILTTSCIYFVCRLLTQKENRITKFLSLSLFIFFVLMGIGLAGVQLVPTLELIQYANLNADKSFIGNYIVPLYHLVSVVVPNYFGNVSTYNYWGKTDYLETVVSIGSIPVLFAFFGFLAVLTSGYKKMIASFYLILLTLSLALAINSPITDLFSRFPIPLLTTDPPSRIFLLSTFSISILAGLGYEYITHPLTSFKKMSLFIAPYLLLIVTIDLITFHNKIVHLPCRISSFACYDIAFRNTVFESIFFVIMLMILFGAVIVKSKKIVIVSIVLVITTGLYNADKFLPFSSQNTILPKNSLFLELSQLSNKGRVFGFGKAMITTNLATYFRFYDPEYYHPLYIKRYGELTGYTNTGMPGHGVVRADAIINNPVIIPTIDAMRRDRFFTLLSVRYLIYNKLDVIKNTQKTNIIWQDNKNYITENKFALPHAYLVSQYQKVSSPKGELQKLFLPEFNPFVNVLLEKEPLHFENNSKPIGHILITSYKENNITITANTQNQSLLVLTDNYYPGWKAFIDNKNTEIYRANYTFRAIVLPSGNHVVNFVYDPLSVKSGELISSISLIILFLLMTFSLLRKFFFYQKNIFKIR